MKTWMVICMYGRYSGWMDGGSKNVKNGDMKE